MTRRRHDPDTADQLVSVSENQQAVLRESEIAAQLTSGWGKPGQGYPAIRKGQMVRRLTPIECERLQGFPDQHTVLEPGDDPNPLPDGRRYAACGDAVTVNVAFWIGKRLKSLTGEGPPVEADHA